MSVCYLEGLIGPLLHQSARYDVFLYSLIPSSSLFSSKLAINVLKRAGLHHIVLRAGRIQAIYSLIACLTANVPYSNLNIIL